MNGTDSTTVLRALRLRREYGRDASLVRAVDGVDLAVDAGETAAVMGPRWRTRPGHPGAIAE